MKEKNDSGEENIGEESSKWEGGGHGIKTRDVQSQVRLRRDKK